MRERETEEERLGIRNWRRDFFDDGAMAAKEEPKDETVRERERGGDETFDKVFLLSLLPLKDK